MRDEFLITRQGKQYVLFAGLLDEAHNRGLKGIDTELIQVPTEENGNVAIVKARVEMEDSSADEGSLRIFSGIGDASPDNVGRNIAPHIIRMAETRAKARALRDAVNVGATALEELSDGDDAPPANYSPSRPPSPRGLQDISGRPPADEGAASSAPNGRDGESPEAAQATPEGTSPRASRRGGGGSSRDNKARKSQVDLLRTLAEELRGENGVARLEGRIGKRLGELSRAEADEWIDRLTPAEGRE